MVTFYDITEQERVNAGLRYEQARVYAVVESLEDYAIFTLDLQSRIMSWNHGAKKIFGYSESEAIGQSGAIIFTPEDLARGEFEKEWAKALSEGRADDERWHIRKDGSRFFASAVLIIEDDGEGFDPEENRIRLMNWAS